MTKKRARRYIRLYPKGKSTYQSAFIAKLMQPLRDAYLKQKKMLPSERRRMEKIHKRTRYGSYNLFFKSMDNTLSILQKHKIETSFSNDIIIPKL